MTRMGRADGDVLADALGGAAGFGADGCVGRTARGALELGAALSIVAGGIVGATGASSASAGAVAAGSTAGGLTTARGAALVKWAAKRSCKGRRAAKPTIRSVSAKSAVTIAALDRRERVAAVIAAGDSLLVRAPNEVGMRLPGTGVQESAAVLDGGGGNAGSTDV